MPKQKLFWIYLVVLHLLLALLVTRTDAYQMLLRYFGVPPAEGSEYQRNVLAFQLRQQPFIPKNSVHLLGDSHIQGLYLNDFCPNAVNLGIGGDTTSGLLARLPYYSSIQSASAVVLLIGYNDLPYRSNVQIIEQYQQLLAQFPSQTKKLLVAIPPPASTFTNFEVAQRVQQLNVELKKLAEGSSQLEFIAGTWQTLPVEAADKLLLTDGIHLAESGYGVLRSQLRQALAKECHE